MNYITFVMSMGDKQYFQHNLWSAFWNTVNRSITDDIRDKCYQHWLQQGAEANETSVEQQWTNARMRTVRALHTSTELQSSIRSTNKPITFNDVSFNHALSTTEVIPHR
jgi:hypothetical protein